MYVDRNDSAAMLAAQKSASVIAEVNLRILLHTDNEVRKHRDPGQASHEVKNVVSVASQKGLMSSKIKKNTQIVSLNNSYYCTFMFLRSSFS